MLASNAAASSRSLAPRSWPFNCAPLPTATRATPAPLNLQIPFYNTIYNMLCPPHRPTRRTRWLTRSRSRLHAWCSPCMLGTPMPSSLSLVHTGAPLHPPPPDLSPRQTDPNWGNFLYLPESELVQLLDFGATIEFRKEFIDDYIEIIHAATTGDHEKCLEFSIKVWTLARSRRRLTRLPPKKKGGGKQRCPSVLSPSVILCLTLSLAD